MSDEPFTAKAIGDRIRHIRSVFHKSQSDIASICGKTKSTVSNWEQGLQRPTIPQALALADALDLTIDYIYTGRTGTLKHALAVKVAADTAPDTAG